MANIRQHLRINPTAVIPVVGMATVWLSLYKQMLYPIMYTYYRAGNEGAPNGQAAYSITLVLIIFALFVAFKQRGTSLLRHRAAIFVIGLGGAVGIALVALGGQAFPGNATLTVIGAVLSALYVPIHFAFWTLNEKRRQAGDAVQLIIWSFPLFCIVLLSLSALGLNNATVSVACPVISSVLVLASPKTSETEREELAYSSSGTTAVPEKAEGAKASAAHGNEAATETDATAAVTDQKSAGAKETITHKNISGEGAQIAPVSQPVAGPATQQPNTDLLPDGFAQSFGLSEREAELAAYARRNWSARRIASELFIAESTVYTHLKRIYRKTDVHSRHELIELIDSWEPAT